MSAGTNTPDEFLPKPSEEARFVPAEDSENGDEEREVDAEDIGDSAIQTNIVMETDINTSKDAMAKMHIRSSAERSGPETTDNSSDVDKTGANNGGHRATSASHEAPLFFVDTVGDPGLVDTSKASGKRPVGRDPSPAPSDSSEEVVVFHGRKNPVQANQSVKPAQRSAPVSHVGAGEKMRSEANTSPAPQPQSQPSSFADVHSTSSQAQTSSRTTAIGWASRTAKFEQEVNAEATWAPAPAGSWWKNRKGKPRPDLDPSPAEKMALNQAQPRPSKVVFAQPPPQLDGAAETIALLQAECRSFVREKEKAKQTSREPDRIDLKSPKPKRRGKRGRKQDNRQLRDPINSDDDNEAEEAAYDDYMSNLEAQMNGIGSDGDAAIGPTAGAHSTAFGGPSLVVDGEEVADDEVIGSHFETMGGDDTSSASSDPIGEDLSEVSSDDDAMDFSNVESSELEETLEYTEREQWEDEEDLRQRRQDARTDEQIARLLAKQQEFGYQGDEIILENGEHGLMSEDIEGVGDVDGARAGLANMSNSAFGRKSSKHGMRRPTDRGSGNSTFIDASLLADTVDQYGANGFDIMDLDRPSLRQTKRGRKGKLPPELDALSDEELKANMRNVWENDRMKKSQKKAEREELRMQGTLGAPGRSGKADLGQKYPFGITRTQIFDELRVFMADDGQQSRPFPPMDKNDRKALHEIANALNLKSKSVGTGKDRFPVLYKTSHSAYTPYLFDRAITASAKGLLVQGGKHAKKLGKKNMKAASKAKAGGKFGGGVSEASLRNGEIVGAGAAELGKENFGHKLMEKMGWSKGMALGKEGEGRLVPVEQIVRLGKGGLG